MNLSVTGYCSFTFVRWTHISFCFFCHEAAQINLSAINKRFERKSCFPIAIQMSADLLSECWSFEIYLTTE